MLWCKKYFLDLRHLKAKLISFIPPCFRSAGAKPGPSGWIQCLQKPVPIVSRAYHSILVFLILQGDLGSHFCCPLPPQALCPDFRVKAAGQDWLARYGGAARNGKPHVGDEFFLCMWVLRFGDRCCTVFPPK